MPHIPVHPSAEKRHRQSLKRAERNRVVRTRARTLAKTAAETIASSTDEAKAREALKQATKVLYKAISSGTMHRNTVRRKVARLSASLHRKFSKKRKASGQRDDLQSGVLINSRINPASASSRSLMVPSLKPTSIAHARQ